jgi:C-terminal processing protease CtpA/Prc
MTTRQAWFLLAELNPVFRDAHTGLQYPTAEFDSYRQGGGAIFPLPVYVDDEGILRFAAGSNYPPQVRPHDEIVSINGTSSQRILSHAMPRMRGETETVRRLVFEYNFAAYLWSLYGSQESHVVVKRDLSGRSQEVVLPQSSESPRSLRDLNAFHYEQVRTDVGYMEIRSFDHALKQDFDRFLTRTFAAIRASGVRKLIIDIRRNPGGAHELSDALLGYLSDKPLRGASSLIARVHESNRDIAPEASVGDVVTVPFEEWLAPLDREYRFDGETYLLIGRRTYSQAIVFATTFQDFNLGKVAGVGTDGWANQTGQVQMTRLTNTGLFAAAPLYIIIRPSGDKTRDGVRPDIPIEDDSQNPRRMVEVLWKSL